MIRRREVFLPPESLLDLDLELLAIESTRFLKRRLRVVLFSVSDTIYPSSCTAIGSRKCRLAPAASSQRSSQLAAVAFTVITDARGETARLAPVKLGHGCQGCPRRDTSVETGRDGSLFSLMADVLMASSSDSTVIRVDGGRAQEGSAMSQAEDSTRKTGVGGSSLGDVFEGAK